MKIHSLLIYMWVLLLIAFNAISVNAQPTPSSTLAVTTVIPPSPTAQAMQKYGDIPVSPYTGVPNISIPLYTIQFHDISVPISLSYHASGIKVAEEASNVGLGWVLNAGGAVTRTIIGHDDFYFGLYDQDHPAYFNQFYDINQADDYQPISTPDGTPANAVIQPQGVLTLAHNGAAVNTNLWEYITAGGSPARTYTEFQPDQFYYNVQGLSGKFLLRRNGQAVLQNQQKVDITFSNNGQTWDIKTVDGFDYQFNEPEIQRSSQEVTSVQHVSAVYLTQITSPTGNVVTFHYTTQLTEQASIGSYTETRDDYVVPQAGFEDFKFNIPGAQNPAQECHTVQLDYIDYGTGRVKFNYVYDRLDLSSDGRLSTVTVFVKDSQGTLATTPVKTVTLGYDYFTGTEHRNPNFSNGGDPYEKRLKLTSVTESGNYNGQSVTQNPYVFTYFEPAGLPSKSSLSRDNWGYYNNHGKTDSSLIPAPNPAIHIAGPSYPYFALWWAPGYSRDANADTMPAFTLTDIKYPTGGTTHLDFEPNDCDEIKSEINDQSGAPFLYSFVPQTYPVTNSSWTPGTANNLADIDVTNGYTDANNTTVPGSITVSIVLNGSSGSKIQVNSNIAKLSIYDQNNNFVSAIDPAQNGFADYAPNVMNVTIPLPVQPGIYHLVPFADPQGYPVEGLPGVYKTVFRISISATWYTQVNDLNVINSTHPVTYSLAGGLRIKRITDNDGINPLKIKRYIYHYNAGSLEYSYGRRMSRPEYSYYEQSVNDANTDEAGGCPTPGCDIHTNSEHLMRLSDSNIPLNGSAQGMVVGYDQVTVNYGENGENGKTVYKYHNNPDQVLPFNWAGLPARRPYNSNIQDPLNGSLLNQTDFRNQDGQFMPVKEVTNTYVKNQAKENFFYAVEDHIQLHAVSHNGKLSSQGYTTLVPNDRQLYVYSPLQSDWTYLSTTDVKDYANADPTKYSESLTSYFYDNPAHYLPTRVVTTNSKGEVMTANTAYPLDYTNLTHTDEISNGVKQLITNHLLNAPVEKFMQKTDADGSNLRTTAGVLTTYAATGTSLPAAVYQLQSVTPLTGFSPYATTGAKNAAYWPVLYFDHYDVANGNLQQQHKYKNVNYAYQWGYNNAYPVAQCKNAAANQFFYEGFEGSTGVISTGGHTGHNYLGASTYAVNWVRPDALTYYISYWYLSAGVWTYSGERSYTTNSYNLTGGTGYDDIRIYPSEAQLSTYTYDIGTGMTSSTDPRGEATYYEYDGLQRLMNIKDANGSIIKNFSYNFADAPVAGQTFYSAARAGVFQKAGCTGTSVGTSALYTVNPGQFTSTLSQADADGKAQQAVSDNGQNYANSQGGCVVPLYYSDEISGPYIPACPPGYITTPVTVNVPFGQFTSSTSKAAANQLAQAYAQTQANSTGVCTVPNVTFTVNNVSGASGFILRFTGPNTINYNVPTTGSGSVGIPPGTYTLTINPPSASGPNYRFRLGSRADVIAPGVTFTNVNISQTGETVLEILNP